MVVNGLAALYARTGLLQVIRHAFRPGLHRGGSDLRVALKRQAVLADGKGLQGAKVAGKQGHRTGWQGKGLAMPVKERKRVGKLC